PGGRCPPSAPGEHRHRPPEARAVAAVATAPRTADQLRPPRTTNQTDRRSEPRTQYVLRTCAPALLRACGSTYLPTCHLRTCASAQQHDGHRDRDSVAGIADHSADVEDLVIPEV